MTFGKTFAAFLLGATSAFALVSGAHAADAQAEQAPAGFNWSGVYVGFGGGVVANKNALDIDLGGGGPALVFNGSAGDGAFAEIGLGYDHMLTDRVLIGAFGNARFGKTSTPLGLFG